MVSKHKTPKNATEEVGKEMLQATADYTASFIEEFNSLTA